MLRRTSLRPMSAKRREAQAQERAQPRQRAYPKRSSIEPLHRAVLGRVEGVVAPAPKNAPWRSRTLLDMARGQPCLLLAVESCRTQDGSTTVACHRNDGKGMAQKQSDEWIVHGCVNCHEWYDRSGAPRAEKRRAFMAAHALRQVPFWRAAAVDQSRPVAQQVAASQALQRIGASPLPVALWFDEPEQE